MQLLHFQRKVLIQQQEKELFLVGEAYVSIGKATAQVEYYFYNSAVPFQYQEGTFKITCSDSGTISDNN